MNKTNAPIFLLSALLIFSLVYNVKQMNTIKEVADTSIEIITKIRNDIQDLKTKNDYPRSVALVYGISLYYALLANFDCIMSIYDSLTNKEKASIDWAKKFSSKALEVGLLSQGEEKKEKLNSLLTF